MVTSVFGKAILDAVKDSDDISLSNGKIFDRGLFFNHLSIIASISKEQNKGVLTDAYLIASGHDKAVASEKNLNILKLYGVLDNQGNMDAGMALVVKESIDGLSEIRPIDKILSM